MLVEEFVAWAVILTFAVVCIAMVGTLILFFITGSLLGLANRNQERQFISDEEAGRFFEAEDDEDLTDECFEVDLFGDEN